jgi:hypothetical protein
MTLAGILCKPKCLTENERCRGSNHVGPKNKKDQRLETYKNSFGLNTKDALPYAANLEDQRLRERILKD